MNDVIYEAPTWKDFYCVDGLMGNDWAMFYVLIGSRECGKSYSVMNYCLKQWDRYGTPFTWIRLSGISRSKMLANNAAKLVDPDLHRIYGLNLKVKGMDVFDLSRDPEMKKPMCKVLALSEMSKEKGVALFDSKYDGHYNIVCDEFILEKGEVRRIDVLYNLVGTLENLVRSRKDKVRIFLICNLSEEANEVLSCGFDFIPEKYGRYKLKRKRCVIDYIEPTTTYLKRRQGTVADILMKEASVFTNKISKDLSMLYKGPVDKLSYIIKFDKTKDKWFCVYDDNVVKGYNNETYGKDMVVAMIPYIDEVFNVRLRDKVVDLYNNRLFRFRYLKDQKVFEKNLSEVRPRG